MNKQMKWKPNIHNIEMKMPLNAILRDFDSFKAEIEKIRNDFEFEVDDVSPMSPTECIYTWRASTTKKGWKMFETQNFELEIDDVIICTLKAS